MVVMVAIVKKATGPVVGLDEYWRSIEAERRRATSWLARETAIA